MATPNNYAPRKMTYPSAVPNMANQVTFEGFLVRAWSHNGYRFLRLANHRPPVAGAASDGPLTVESDYVTVRLDSSVLFDMNRANPGLRLLVRGRIEGHDIPETIGDILRHCNLNVRLPLEIAHLTVSRPAVQIFGTSLEFRRDKAAGGPRQSGGDKHGRHLHQGNHQKSLSEQPAGASREPIRTAETVGPEAPRMDAAPAPDGIQPGQDVSEIARAIDSRKVRKPDTKENAAVIETPRKGAAKKAGSKATTTKATSAAQKETKAKKSLK